MAAKTFIALMGLPSSLFLLHVLRVPASPVPLIIDTDIGGGACHDVDDVAAVCMAHALADNGEAEIIATVINSDPPPVAGALSVLNHYYGRDDVPIGAYKGDGLQQGRSLPYVLDLAKNFSSPVKSTKDVPSAVEVYRKALAAQPPHSVVISSIGMLVNLADLLQSPPDKYSILPGYYLIANKVKLILAMAGQYPGSSGVAECNICGCRSGATKHSAETAATAAEFVFSNMPPGVKVMFLGFEVGIRVFSGGKLSNCTPTSNPCRAAFENYFQRPSGNRFSWDPLATLVAVRGPAAASCAECTNCTGFNNVSAITGNNLWTYDVNATSNQSYLVLKNGTAAGNSIDDLLCQPPKRLPKMRLPPPVFT